MLRKGHGDLYKAQQRKRYEALSMSYNLRDSTFVGAYPLGFLDKAYLIFLVSYVGERPWWSIQSLNKGRKKKAKR